MRHAVVLFVLAVSWSVGAYFGEKEHHIHHISRQPECYETGTFHFDECERRCRCVHGRLVECTRLRKEFTAMTEYEKRRYIETIKVISWDVSFQSTWNSFLRIHQDLFNKGIHTVEQFLPWHRWYVHQYENLIRRYDCRLTVPFWDWSVVASDPWSTASGSLWDLGPTGFGGNGSSSDQCVKTGPFREGQFYLVPGVGGGCITRAFNGFPHDAATVQSVMDLSVSEFFQMDGWIREQFHNNIHNRIGGNMADGTASGTPEFFLHHATLDKLWKDWQDQSLAHKFAYFPFSNAHLLGTPYDAMDYVDSYALPGGDRVEYVDSEKHKEVYARLN